MSSSRAVRSQLIEAGEVLAFVHAGVVSGEVVRRTANGELFIDYVRNSLGPLPARTLVEDVDAGMKVLLAFDEGDPTRPIILGVIFDRARTKSRMLHLKAARIVLEAQDELVMHCGQGAFEARKDGKVQVRGRDIVSRAERSNKVRGATVLIN
jgi:hypothetical protein